MKTIRAFWRDSVAATAIEYGLIAFLVSISIVAGASMIGTKINAKFTPISGNLN